MSIVKTNDEAKTLLGYNVRRILGELGLSQGELARRTGDSVMTISNIANGLHLPKYGVVLRIAEALGVGVEDLNREPPPAKSRKTA